MARRLVQYVEITDDYNREKPADETLEFAIDGTVYELDCTAEKAQEIRDALASAQEVAHDKWKMPARPGRGKRKPITAQANNVEVTPKPSKRGEGSFNLMMRDRAARNDIRDWGIANGYPAPKTGQIPTETLMAYVDNNPDAYVPESTLIHAGLEIADAS